MCVRMFGLLIDYTETVDVVIFRKNILTNQDSTNCGIQKIYYLKSLEKEVK